MRSISFTITVLVLAGFYFAVKDYPTPARAEPYHEVMLKQVEAVPDLLGKWRTFEKPQPPPAAQQLLRPNSLLSRRLRKDDTNLLATLIVIQTKDSRDMGGHYPPVCYPSSGWEKKEEWPPPQTVQVGKLEVPYQIYTFEQSTFRSERKIKIYCFFAIPSAGFATNIKSVREAAENYRMRPFGCAQIQVIVDAEMPEDQAKSIFVELMTEIEPLLTDLSGDPMAVAARGAAVDPSVVPAKQLEKAPKP